MASLILPAHTVLQASPRTRLLTLALGDQPFSFDAGQAVFAGLADSPVRRPYSIASSPTRAREMKAIELLVQIDDHRAPDPHLERVAPGTPVAIEGPFGSFGLPSPIRESRLLFIAGGTGIAPLRSMLWELLVQQPEVAAALLYSARSREEFAFRDELVSLDKSGRLELQMIVTRETDDWGGSRGRLDGAVIRAMLKTDATRCIVCGPPSMVSDAVALLEAAGVSPDRIVYEAFQRP